MGWLFSIAGVLACIVFVVMVAFLVLIVTEMVNDWLEEKLPTTAVVINACIYVGFFLALFAGFVTLVHAAFYK